MKIDGALSMRLETGAPEAAEFEDMGLDGVWSFEGNHDPFIPLTLATQTTTRIELGTAIAVAFARTPMITAHTAWDLQRLSNGRFILGLGTQIRPHIEKRYSMPWSRPAARLAEFVHTLRAIWHSWSTGDRLDFRGEFYTHTLMPPFFSPAPLTVETPKVYLAGVGLHMMRTIGEVADGFFVHPFHTPEFLAAETLPALAEGVRAAQRDGATVDVAALTIVAMGTTEEELADARRKAKAQLAFYGSTPAYAGVLRHHGYEDLQPELNTMSKQGRWTEMTDLIDDRLLDLIAVSGSPADVGRAIAHRNSFAQRSTLMFYGAAPTRQSVAEAVAASRSSR